MRSRIRSASVILGSLTVLSGWGGVQAALIQKDSADFTNIYDFTSVTDPATAGGIGTGWTWHSGSELWPDPTASSGIVTYKGTGHWLNSFTTPNGSWTAELNLQVTTPSTVRWAIGIYAYGAPTDQSGLVNLNGTVVNWIDEGNPAPGGTNYSYNNADTFHTIRLAFDASDNQYTLWRDGALVAGPMAGDTALAGGAPLRLYIGDLGGEWQDTGARVDMTYIRVDTGGAYAPAVPEPASLGILTATGLLALRRRRS